MFSSQAEHIEKY